MPIIGLRRTGRIAVLPLALGLLALSASPAAALPEPITYVALGDSYSAGQGSIPFTESVPPCNRSPLGYPALLDLRTDVVLVRDETCAGDDTERLRLRLPSVPDRSVRLVTLTIGGNNLGFSRLPPECALDVTLGTCPDLLTVTPQEEAQLRAALIETYGDVSAAYPKARVVVLTYPRLFPGPVEALPSSLDPLKPFIQKINEGSEILNSVIVEAAKEAHVRLVEVRDEFDGHEALTADPWIGFNVPDPLANLHPTATGYEKGYYQALLNDKIVK